MWRDPTVEKVRQAGEELDRRAGYSLHTLLENLRKNEKERKTKTVSRVNQDTDRKQAVDLSAGLEAFIADFPGTEFPGDFIAQSLWTTHPVFAKVPHP